MNENQFDFILNYTVFFVVTNVINIGVYYRSYVFIKYTVDYIHHLIIHDELYSVRHLMNGWDLKFNLHYDDQDIFIYIWAWLLRANGRSLYKLQYGAESVLRPKIQPGEKKYYKCKTNVKYYKLSFSEWVFSYCFCV